MNVWIAILVAKTVFEVGKKAVKTVDKVIDI